MSNPVDVFLQQCVSVDEMNLKSEYIRLPADLAFWSSELAEAQRRYQMAKIDLERVEAAALIQHRNSLEVKRDKVTESMVSALVSTDVNVQSARAFLVECEVDKAKVNGTVDAIRAKKDMLISLGATVRAEMERGPSLNDRTKGSFTPYQRNGQ